MGYLLDDLEKTAELQKFRLDREQMNYEVDRRKHRLWEDAQDIKLGIMQPKEKIKPKFRTMKKGRFNQFIEDSDRFDRIMDQMYDRQMRRQEVRLERNEAERKANEAKYKIQEQANQKEWDQFFADAKKSEIRRRVKPFAIAGAGAATLGGGAYLYNRYKKKKREQAEQEKTAINLLDDLEKTADTIRYDDKGNPMVSMYDDDSISYIDNLEKNVRGLKRIGPGIAMAGLGIGLDSLKEKMPNSAVKNIPQNFTDGLILGGTGLAAVGGTYNYLKERNRNKRIAAYDQKKDQDKTVREYRKANPGSNLSYNEIIKLKGKE